MHSIVIINYSLCDCRFGGEEKIVKVITSKTNGKFSGIFITFHKGVILFVRNNAIKLKIEIQRLNIWTFSLTSDVCKMLNISVRIFLNIINRDFDFVNVSRI